MQAAAVVREVLRRNGTDCATNGEVIGDATDESVEVGRDERLVQQDREAGLSGRLCLQAALDLLLLPPPTLPTHEQMSLRGLRSVKCQGPSRLPHLVTRPFPRCQPALMSVMLSPRRVSRTMHTVPIGMAHHQRLRRQRLAALEAVARRPTEPEGSGDLE